MTTVGDRTAAIFRGNEPPDHAYATDRPAAPATSADATPGSAGYVWPHANDVEPEPELPVEVADRLRSLMREGDWQSAAQYAARVLDSLGIEVPGGQPGGQEERDRA